MKIVTAQQMREIDGKAAESGISTEFLMENAGRVVAEETKEFIDFIAGKSILALAGPGNNGGDALVAARYLHEWGADVNVYLLSGRTLSDRNLKKLKEHDVPFIHLDKDTIYSKLKSLLSTAGVVIDGILARARHGPLRDNSKRY